MNRVDVLVVGLGPAGASAATAAARSGARVLALDRRPTPGLPVQCAEFVPALLGADTAAVRLAALQEIAAMDTYLGGTCTHTPDFRGVMIDRAAFDAALVDEARAAGATIITAEALLTVENGEARLASGDCFYPQVIIGADGPRSTVGRLSGMENRALVEARQITVPLTAPHQATDIFLSPEMVGGYGWLFPRGAEANLGLGVAPEAKALLKPLLETLRRQLVAEGRIGPAIRRLTGGAIPVGGICGLEGRAGGMPVLLAGDAAGLANPITGAGINAAVLSGRLAGDAAARIAAGKPEAAVDYAEEVTDLLGPSLALALQRRGELMSHYARGGLPGPAALRRSWIAFGDYWQRSPLPEEIPA
ncbi:geranylgeranyl reductase family protein [Rhodobacter ferrooxidans]|uniref:Geranylgeranyl reductase n=1 Tax=Rhodobacter ferrooxidans TaxID=371731 RepID=C8S1C6_9RHOB|nr:NAD(P)/FAD-dependent oxidoreductase [Rhodobacter sp. SW2]EEW25324.1 geranylgeranyl reductase [Rhodobacter sp. SW2]